MIANYYDRRSRCLPPCQCTPREALDEAVGEHETCHDERGRKLGVDYKTRVGLSKPVRQQVRPDGVLVARV